MNVYGAIGDFLKEHGREEWGEMVARLTGKVYVLCDYDMDPVGVFSSEEAATRHDPTLEVKEFTIDDLLAWEDGPVYTATIRMSDGEIHDIGHAPPCNRHPTRCRIDEHGSGRDWHRIIVRSPVSTAHAMQAAMDRRDEIRRAEADQV